MEELVGGCGKSQEIRDRQDSPSREHVQNESPRRFVRPSRAFIGTPELGAFTNVPPLMESARGENSLEIIWSLQERSTTADVPLSPRAGPVSQKADTDRSQTRKFQRRGENRRRRDPAIPKRWVPDKHLLSRPESTRASEEQHCHTLLPFWNSIELTAVTFPVCDDYRDWRLDRITKGEGLRAVDCELSTLSSAFRYSKSGAL